MRLPRIPVRAAIPLSVVGPYLQDDEHPQLQKGKAGKPAKTVEKSEKVDDPEVMDLLKTLTQKVSSLEVEVKKLQK